MQGITISKDSITLIIQGKSYTLKRTDPKFQEVFDIAMKAVKEENESLLDSIPPLINKGLAIEKWAKGNFKYSNNQITYKGEPLDSQLHSRLIEMSSKGEDPTPWFLFWEKLQDNPSFRSVNQLYGFMNNSNIAISANGDILAYKAVRKDDFCDFHSGRHKNTVGSVHEMPRNKISDDPKVACHDGFHVGAYNYAKNFNSSGGNQVIVICSINPTDVVCVPFDSSQQKMRVCRYKVIGIYGQPLSDTVEPEINTEHVEAIPGEVFNDIPKEDIPKEKFELTEDEEDWHSLNLDNLRKFASRKLKIVGASRMKREALEKVIDSLLK